MAVAGSLKQDLITKGQQIAKDFSEFEELSVNVKQLALFDKSSTRETPDHPPFKLLDLPVVMSQFSFPIEVRSICPRKDGQIWVLEWHFEEAYLLDNKGEIKQTVSPCSKINDICVSPVTDRLWLCTEDRTVQELQDSDTPVKQFKTKDEPSCLCITKDECVIVGTMGRLTAYTAAGSVLRTSTNEEETIFKPLKMSSCPATGNVSVINCHYDRVLVNFEELPFHYVICIDVYNDSLKLLLTYRGEGIQGNPPVTPFNPRSISYDSFGNMIIADITRKRVDLINGSGQNPKTLYRTGGCIIGLGFGNRLWIYMENGEENGIMKRLKYIE